MKKIIFSLILLVTVSFTTFAQENWHQLTNNTAKYIVEFSGDIEQTNIEKETSSTYKIVITDGEMSYMISSTKHQRNIEDDIDNLLYVSINSFKESIKDTVLSQEEVYRNYAKGIYTDMTIQNGSVKLEYFVFIKGKNQYQVMAYAVKESYDQKDADRFFNSFEILE